MILNDDFLDNILVDVIMKCKAELPHWAKFYEAYYHLGVRAREAITPQLWAFPTRDTIVLQPQKNNNLRYFSRLEMPLDFLRWLEYQGFLQYQPTYSQLNYYFNQLCIYREIWIGNKQSSLHLFRHNYAHKLHRSGLSDVEIQIKMGEKQLSSAQEYIYSQISTIKL